MDMFFRLLIAGLVIGSIYGLVALGYCLIYKASGLMSFVQGDMLTLGGFLGVTAYGALKLPFAAAVFLVMFLPSMRMNLLKLCRPSRSPRR